MAATRRAKLALAGPDYTPVPAMPLGGPVTVVAATSGAAVDHAVAEATSLVQFTTDADVYYAAGGAASAGGLLLYAKATATHSVDAGAVLSFRAVTGSASIRVLEA